MSTRTYYRGPDAVVTDELFVWRGEATKGFAIRDLRNVGRTRGDENRSRPRVSTVAAAMVLAAAAWTMLDSPMSYAVTALAIAGPAAAAGISRLTRTPHWELRASYRNQEVVIYTATDERVFNQVSRALRRSMEAARSPATDHGLTAA